MDVRLMRLFETRVCSTQDGSIFASAMENQFRRHGREIGFHLAVHAQFLQRGLAVQQRSMEGYFSGRVLGVAVVEIFWFAENF